MKFHRIFPLLIILITFVTGLYLYPYLPDTLATHWNINGQVDGYSSKLFALFVMPVVSILLYLLFIFLPRIEPYKKNFLEFDQYFYLFINIIFGFLFYIYLLTMFWHVGIEFNMIQALSPAFFVVYLFAGILCQKAKMNWFIGFRTPWVYHSQQIWSKTNRLAGKLFVFSSFLSLLGLLLPQLGIYLIVLPPLVFSLAAGIYSYFLYYNSL